MRPCVSNPPIYFLRADEPNTFHVPAFLRAQIFMHPNLSRPTVADLGILFFQMTRVQVHIFRAIDPVFCIRAYQYQMLNEFGNRHNSIQNGRLGVQKRGLPPLYHSADLLLEICLD